MYLILKYTVLTILLYQCITIYSYDIGHEKLENVFGYDEIKPGGNHCTILFTPLMVYFMPVPYHVNASGGASIIMPDRDGRFFVAHKRSFQLSCSGTTFIAPTACVGLTEVTVECRGGDVFAYDGDEYDFDLFRCNALPKAKLTAANESCSGIADGVFDVGFYTRHPFSLYKVCYDARVKRTLYSWNFVDTPLFASAEMSTTLAPFVETEHFENVEHMDLLYERVQVQNKSQSLDDVSTTRFVGKTIREFIVPGHLLFRNQFFYAFQQFATYFYENTAPLWGVFNNGVWKDVERLFLQSLYSYKGKHLMVTGTINSTQMKIPPKTAQKLPTQQWIGDMPVPLYVWRMIYNIRNKRGIVFVGFNSPYRDGDRNMHFCKKVACPGRLGQTIEKTNLVFCCTIESFEKVYGPLDPIVYREF